MTKILVLLIPLFSFAEGGTPITPLPIFLKEGFSTILEFDELPSKVVLGDSQSFHIERLDRSLVIKPLEPYAVANLFVYFNRSEARLFLLTASEEAEPTFHRSFKSEKPTQAKARKPQNFAKGIKLLKSNFDSKKDFLVLEVAITADSEHLLIPEWEKVRLLYKKKDIKPTSLWSERKIIQKDSRIKARFEFARPNLSKNLKDVRLVVPLKGWKTPLSLNLGGDR